MYHMLTILLIILLIGLAYLSWHMRNSIPIQLHKGLTLEQEKRFEEWNKKRKEIYKKYLDKKKEWKLKTFYGLNDVERRFKQILVEAFTFKKYLKEVN